ncbi:hypothetical protein V2J09_003501 [Rumex salicifolius]
MRTSCNGCRVLRKGCTDDCAIRPSVEWILSPDSQANATLFLAKFYGRAGLLNLLAAAHPHALRPAIFKSLLYEACGRIVDPVNGSAGLMYSGQWHHCQAAVDAVLKGLPILQLPQDPTPGGVFISPDAALKICDIRHVSSSSVQIRTRARTSSVKGKKQLEEEDDDHEDESMFSNETVEPTMANRAEPDANEPGLELTLGMTHYRSSCSWS